MTAGRIQSKQRRAGRLSAWLFPIHRELYPQTGLRNTWNAEPAMKIVTEFEMSLKKHPPIPSGTPDPYTPK